MVNGNTIVAAEQAYKTDDFYVTQRRKALGTALKMAGHNPRLHRIIPWSSPRFTYIPQIQGGWAVATPQCGLLR